MKKGFGPYTGLSTPVSGGFDEFGAFKYRVIGVMTGHPHKFEHT